MSRWMRWLLRFTDLILSDALPVERDGQPGHGFLNDKYSRSDQA